MLFHVSTFVLVVSGINCLCAGDENKDDSILKLVETVEKLNHKLDKLQTKVKSLEETNKMAEKRQDIASSTGGAYPSEAPGLNSIVEVHIYNLSVMDCDSDIAREVVAPIAFTVSLTKSRQVLGQNQPIEYDHVITNLGNGYDARYGHFTAPMKGLYLFSVTLMSPYNSNPNDLYAELIKNGVNIVPLYAASENNDSTSATVFLTLNAKDMIWVRATNRVGQTIHGGGYDIFSGLLISQLQ